MTDRMNMKMIWAGDQVLSSGAGLGMPVRVFEPSQPSVQWYVEQRPLVENWVALKSIYHGGYYTSGPNGVLITAEADEATFSGRAGLDLHGFLFVPEGTGFLLENRHGQQLKADSFGGFLFSSERGTVFTVQEATLEPTSFAQQVNCCFNTEQAPHTGRHQVRAPQWDDKEHRRLISSAFALIEAHSTLEGAKRPIQFFSNSLFKSAVFSGLYDADYKAEYNDTFGIIPTYKSHFYDPSTKLNWLGEKAPTALTRAITFAYKSLSFCALIEDGMSQGKSPSDMGTWYEQAGYFLGLALHYVTDLSQPMHAANFVNWPLSGDWRHSGFESVAENVGAKYQLDPRTTQAREIDPATLGCSDMADVVNALALRQKKTYDELVRPLLARKVRVVSTGRVASVVYTNTFTEEECAPIFRTALPDGQRYTAAFLLTWGRVTDQWSQVQTFQGHSAWAPVFFQYKNKLWVGVSDSDSWRINLMPYEDMNAYPTGAIRVGDDNTPVVGYESPAIACGDDLIFLAYHDKGNNDLYICNAEGNLRPDMSWNRLKIPSARVKAYTNPAMARLGDTLVLVWADYGNGMPGQGDRDGLYVMYYDLKARNGWTDPARLPTRDSQHSPTLTVYRDQLVMAWGGYHGGEPIFTAQLALGSREWSSQARLPDATSTDRGPALAVQGDVMYLFWRVGDRIWYATGTRFDNFSNPMLLPVDKAWCHQDLQAYSDGNTLYVGWDENWVMKYVTRKLR